MISFRYAMTTGGAAWLHTTTLAGYAMYFICMCWQEAGYFLCPVVIHHNVDRVKRPLTMKQGFLLDVWTESNFGQAMT